MSSTTEAKTQTALGLGGLPLIVCCIAGPAVLGAIGGAATGSIALGTVIAAHVAVSAHAVLPDPNVDQTAEPQLALPVSTVWECSSGSRVRRSAAKAALPTNPRACGMDSCS